RRSLLLPCLVIGAAEASPGLPVGGGEAEAHWCWPVAPALERPAWILEVRRAKPFLEAAVSRAETHAHRVPRLPFVLPRVRVRPVPAAERPLPAERHALKRHRAGQPDASHGLEECPVPYNARRHLERPHLEADHRLRRPGARCHGAP